MNGLTRFPLSLTTGLLRQLEDLVGQNFAAYADDLVVVVNGDSRAEIETEGQRVVDAIVSWCQMAKLQLSERKTEAILLKSDVITRKPIGRRGGARPDRKRKTTRKIIDFGNKPPTIRVNKTKIGFKSMVRYLGVHLDRGLRVTSHCRILKDKVESLFHKLGRLARAQWGLRFRTLHDLPRSVRSDCGVCCIGVGRLV